MAPSRWANTAEDDEENEVRRRQEKEEKKRRKEEKQRKALEVEAAQKERERDALGNDREDARPSKRRRTSTEPDQGPAEAEGAHLLHFPTRGFRPSRDVERYELLNNIEEGSYGWVSRARSKDNGDIVALKRLKLDHNRDGFPVTGLREIQTLKACQHTNIVHLREVVVSPDLKNIYLVMDFIEHDLKTLLEDMTEPFLPSETKTLMHQLVSATAYLHQNWILHRDLKTSNLLLNNQGELKLADFGMARYTGNPPPRLTQLVVTLWYRPPELLLGAEEYGFEVDLWSVGCIFGELLTKQPIFQGKNEVDQLSKIFSTLGIPTKESWPNFRLLSNAKALHPILSKMDSAKWKERPGFSSSHFPYLTHGGLRLLNSLLSQNPDDRPTATEVLSHPYFREDPRPKARELFPTFPSKAGQEKRRRKATPQAPNRGDIPPSMQAHDFAAVAKAAGLFDRHSSEEEK